MILTFKPQFIEPIKAGTKIHTIREDKKGRWKPGMKIQFWNGNPRNVKAKPFQFQSGICIDVKHINDWAMGGIPAYRLVLCAGLSFLILKIFTLKIQRYKFNTKR